LMANARSWPMSVAFTSRLQKPQRKVADNLSSGTSPPLTGYHLMSGSSHLLFAGPGV
jgi:hypothetical protein